MKKIILFTLLISLISCGRSNEQIKKDDEEILKKSKFKEGEIVYVKPDSTKAVIVDLVTDYDDCYCNVIGYHYKIRSSKGEESIKENLIYLNQESEY
jgi:hypothetical protein